MATRAINRKPLVEASILIAFGLVAMIEGLRLIIDKDPYVFYDPVGPGFYVLALSVGLLIVGVVHLVAHSRKSGAVVKSAATGDTKPLIRSIVILVLYLFLISFVGYLLATLLFFLLQLRVSGVRSWRTNVIFTLLFTAVYYVVFVRFCEMVFPGGIFG
jgi:putative tricarboxylic transport membrane protein